MDRTIDLLLRNLRSEIARLEKKNEEAVKLERIKMATIARLNRPVAAYTQEGIEKMRKESYKEEDLGPSA